METTRKKALELMQRGIVTYKLVLEGWDVSHHVGDGYDLIAHKDNKCKKIELKAIDMKSIKKGKNATQQLSANEIVNSTHLIITVFDKTGKNDEQMEISNYIMTMKQFVENSGVKK